MTQIAKKVEQEIERDIADLELARDEISLKIHLAGMDAKTAWNDLQKKFALLAERMNRKEAHLEDETKALAKDIKESLLELKSRL
jgi:hypothetical protein